MISSQSVAAGLYLVLNCLAGDEIIEYDLSDIIKSGWIKRNVGDNISFKKIIILTEGRFDSAILHESPKLEEKQPYHYLNIIFYASGNL